jgi:hypothetical protein
MRILVTSIVIGLLVPMGAQLASADQPIRSRPSIQLAAAGASTGDRNTYVQKTRDEMQEWQRKLHDFSEKAKAKGQAAGSAAKIDLNKAWVRAEAEARKLPTVGAEGWGSAKTSFEQASRELASAWDKIRPQEK